MRLASGAYCEGGTNFGPKPNDAGGGRLAQNEIIAVAKSRCSWRCVSEAVG